MARAVAVPTATPAAAINKMSNKSGLGINSFIVKFAI